MIKLLLIGLLAFGQVKTVEPTIVDISEVSRYEVVRAPEVMKIDGDVTAKEWGRANVISEFSDVFQPERAVKYPTVARMMWDDKYWYISFEAFDHDIWSKMDKHDDFVFAEQAVEVFIDPEGDGKRYLEVDVGPSGGVVDLMLMSKSFIGLAARNATYDMRGLLTGVKVYGTLDDRTDTDEKWTVEIAIPWAEFAGRRVTVPPNDGDSWRVNLFRVAGQEKYPKTDQYLSWSKSPGVFHEPANFGIVTFRK